MRRTTVSLEQAYIVDSLEAHLAWRRLSDWKNKLKIKIKHLMQIHQRRSCNFYFYSMNLT